MNTHIQGQRLAPPGHERVSDDLLIYTLPNWTGMPEEMADAPLERDFFWVVPTGIFCAVLVGLLLLVS